MQLKDVNWTIFGWSLVAALIVGISYAMFIRWVSKKKLVGQTAWSVVIGVTFTLLTMIPFFGLDQVALIFCFFGAAGVPMIIEYVARVQTEIDEDNRNAQELAKDLVNNDHKTSDR